MTQLIIGSNLWGMKRSNLRLRLHWAKLLKQARLDAGLSQRQLRERLAAGGYPVAPEVVSRWENGVYSPSDENRPRLAAALGKSVHDLFPYELPPTNGDIEAA